MSGSRRIGGDLNMDLRSKVFCKSSSVSIHMFVCTISNGRVPLAETAKGPLWARSLDPYAKGRVTFTPLPQEDRNGSTGEQFSPCKKIARRRQESCLGGTGEPVKVRRTVNQFLKMFPRGFGSSSKTFIFSPYELLCRVDPS